ncbi:ATP-dependent zinc protease [Candidatus Woesearchaeota archaeon]|nr:ATP-dependent zinc protease [Candidatus Woesearchaeota archaeon]
MTGKEPKKTERLVIGLSEPITLIGLKGKKKVIAKVDTGADKSSIDLNLAAELQLGPVVKISLIKSASGNRKRPIIGSDVIFAGREMKVHFSIADRSHMKYKVLIGKNILKKGFLIDPSRD